MSTGFPMSWRLGSLTACSAVLLLAAGCGGSASKPAAPPRFPREVASALASRADAVAAALERGDACTARGGAYALSRAADGAEVPPVFRVKLLSAVRELAAALPPCSPPPPPPPAPPPTPPAKKHKKGEHAKKEHGKKHGHGKGHD